MMPSNKPLLMCDIKELICDHPGPCVSIYLPTSHSGRSTREGRILLKNLNKVVDNKLQDNDMRWDAIADLMGRAHALVENEEFWEYQSEGLALFIAPGFRIRSMFCRFFKTLIKMRTFMFLQ